MRRATGAVLLALALVAGCSPATGPGPAAAPGCATVAEDADGAQAALDAVPPGGVVCLRGDGIAGADLRIGRSGAPGAPVVLDGGGAAVRSVTVAADHVVVRGVRTVAGGAGIDLTGTDLAVLDSHLDGPELDGVSCVGCTDAVIRGTTVDGADGSGVLVEGTRIQVLDNTVRGSVRRRATDADGIRFFGTALTLSRNEISDIGHGGYTDAPPHTDCFQTFDNSRPPTRDVTISDNVCRDVADQCLIATAEVSGAEGDVGRSRDIRFVGNRCDVGAAQAVLVRWVPGVVITGNVLDGPGLDRGAYLGDGSTGARFTGNTTPPGVRPVQADASSQAGLVSDRPE
ncbi:right-handed parallel beta-helix repeat-containing protein [Pseudonocardia spirodelae]|uniref:Right-handed parallel beta-helix repeat-containing protein n=1 Tax=Pseudonocardia spirodelae TaxID=3133431 RepID=A0ABU8T2W0_9PSEU